jgi:arylamine N-acetyltransferase
MSVIGCVCSDEVIGMACRGKSIHTPGGGRSLNGSHASLVVSINDVFYVTDVGFGV